MPSISTRYLVAFSAILAACGGDLTLPTDGGGGAPGGPGGPGTTLSITDDRFTTLEGNQRTLTVPSPGVLENDLVNGSAGTALRAALVSEPAHGQAVIGADGSLAYTPDPGWFGTDRFTYRASLSSGASAEGAVDVIVEPVNDSPEFTAGPDQEATREHGHDHGDEGRGQEDRRGEVTVENWATAIRPGPANEADQSVTFLVNVISGDQSLIGTPSISASGTLHYLPSDHEGIARVEVRLKDDGGTENGGQDTSPPHTLIIVVTQ
jgi:hypothetical protein